MTVERLEQIQKEIGFKAYQYLLNHQLVSEVSTSDLLKFSYTLIIQSQKTR